MSEFIIEESHKYPGCFNIYGAFGRRVHYFAEVDDKNEERAKEWVAARTKQVERLDFLSNILENEPEGMLFEMIKDDATVADLLEIITTERKLAVTLYVDRLQMAINELTDNDGDQSIPVPRLMNFINVTSNQVMKDL